MTFLGGRASLWGPVLGAIILEGGQQTLAYNLGGSQFYLVAYALIFLVIMLVLPRGILPTLQDKVRLRGRRRRVDAAGGTGVVAPARRSGRVASTQGGGA
jgi:branched-chain amino acid transport system permease protein